jgi:hypothetical protein
MPSTILSDNGVTSGTSGIKTTGSNDGTLALQTTTAGGAATTALTIDTSQNVTLAGTLTTTGTTTFNGNQIISVTDNTNAALRITQLGTGNALLVEDSTNPDSTPFVIDGTGFVFVGNTTSTTTAVGSAKVQILGGTNPLAFYRGADSTTPINLEFAKARAAGAILASGDTIGRVYFSGSDGTAQIPAAYIDAAVDGTPGTNDMPGRLVFSTTADGASTVTERMRINSAGNVGIGTTAPQQRLGIKAASNVPQLYLIQDNVANDGWKMFADSSAGYLSWLRTSSGSDSEKMRLTLNGTVVLAGGSTSATGVGITFPATQSASSDANTLDDYEEGTWTPTITFGGGSTGLTYASQKGNYTKVGNRVCISGYVAMSNKGSSTGEIAILGLPFTSASVTDMYNCSPVWAATLTSVSGSLEAYNRPNTAYFSMQYLGTGTTANISQANCNNNSDFMINLSYSI